MTEQRLSPTAAVELVVSLLVAYGASTADAGLVAEHLVDSERVGLPSHGLIRVPQYVDEVLSGDIDPAGLPAVHRQRAGRVDIDGRRCFGQVAADHAVRHGISLATEHGVGLVTVRQSGHAGRVGAYAERLGEAGFVSVIFCSGPRSGHRVSPFNGCEGRLATNPIAFSFPTSGYPVVGDFSTAAAPEGRIRWLRDLSLDVPVETLLDAQGSATVDPNVLYVTPPGTIMPFGGERWGHRGYALGLLVEAMATLSVGDEVPDPSRVGNNLAFVVVSVDGEFAHRADRMAEYVRSSQPRSNKPVVLPGSTEQARRADNREIAVPQSTWQAIVARAKNVGLLLGAAHPVTKGAQT